MAYKLFVFVSLLLFFLPIQAQTNYTWTGNTSSNWNDTLNWSPNGIPSSNSHSVLIDNSNTTFSCILPQNINLHSLNVRNNARLSLNNFSITLTNNLTLNKANIYDSGSITAENIAIQKTYFNDAITLIKSGGTTNDCEGANFFAKSAYFINFSNSRIRLANSFGDTFKGISFFDKRELGNFEIAYSGVNVFEKNIILNSDTSGTISFGLDQLNSGSTYLLNNSALKSNRFTKGNLHLFYFYQSNAIKNDSFKTTNCIIKYAKIKGNTRFLVDNDLTISNSSLYNSNYFSVKNDIFINLNNFLSTDSGITQIIKNGGGIDDWLGGNTFGNLLIQNNDNSRIRMGINEGDTFKGNVQFIEKNSGNIEPAYNNNNYFYKDISIEGSNSSVTLGLNTGNCIIKAKDSINIKSDTLIYPIFNKLTINTSINDAIYLKCKVIISEQLNLIKGIVNTSNSNIIYLDNESVTVNIGSDSSFINGPMDIEFNTNSTTLTNLIFPLGKKSWNVKNAQYMYQWRPIELNVGHTANTSYTYRAEMFLLNGNSLNWQLPNDVDTASNIRYWTVQRFLTSSMSPSNNQLRTNTGSHPTIKLYFDTTDGVFDGSNLCVLKNKPFALNTWFNIGGTNTPPYLNGKALKGSITSTSDSFNNFSTFTLGSLLNGYNPLPINIISFKAQLFSNYRHLEWETSHNIEYKEFIIEKSTDGLIWQKIGNIPINYSSQITETYSFIDSTATSPKIEYRLSALLNDNSKQLLATQTVYNTLNKNFVIFPNPSNGYFNIKSKLKPIKPEDIRIYNLNGELFQLKMKQINKQELEIETPLLNRGVYIIVIIGNQDFEKIPLIIY